MPRSAVAAVGPVLAPVAGVRGTNAWPLVRPVVELATRIGLDRRAVLRRLRLRRGGDDARVPIERVLDVWADCARAAKDPSLPVRLGQAVRLDDLHLMGFAILTAPTGRDALLQAIRYAPLVTDSGRWSAELAGDRAIVRWERAGDRTLGHRIANEAGLAQFVGCMRQICGGHFTPAGASFRHAAPASVAAHRAFFRCGIEFDAAEDAFWFRAAALDVVPANANTGLAAFVRDEAERRLQRLAASTSAQARASIDRAVGTGDRPQAAATALALGTSERTLRRRLTEEGTSFSALVDAAVRVRARELVVRSARPLTAIALDLGFADASAFSHAFRRWYGCAPRELRARG